MVMDISEFCSDGKGFCPSNSVMKFRVSKIQNALYVNSDKTSDVLVNIYKKSMDYQ